MKVRFGFCSSLRKFRSDAYTIQLVLVGSLIFLRRNFLQFNSPLALALKCDLRDDPAVKERLKRYGLQSVQYEEGLAVARRIRASRYLGTLSFDTSNIT